MSKGGAKAFSSTVSQKINKPHGYTHKVPHGERIVSSRLLTQVEKDKWLEDRIGEYGTNSMLDPLVQGAKFLGKKIAPGVINDDSYRRFLVSYQNPLLKADKAMGEFLSKTPKVGGIFKTVEDAPSVMNVTDKGTKVIGTVKKDAYKATAPIDKIKKPALPMLGILGIQQVAELTGGSGEGDALVPNVRQSNNIRTAEINTELIEKISSLVNTKVMEKNSSLLKAADMLKKAVGEIKRLEQELNKTAEDNKRLTLEIIAKERSRRSIKLAKDMLSKSLIKQAEFDNEVDRIMDMDDNAFSILDRTVKNARKEASVVTDKLDRIAGIYDYSTDSRSSFKDELLKG